MPRPAGRPQYGWTASGHIVDLTHMKGKVYKGTDPIKLVTAQGWDDWYPVLPDEMKPKHKQHGMFDD